MKFSYVLNNNDDDSNNNSYNSSICNRIVIVIICYLLFFQFHDCRSKNELLGRMLGVAHRTSSKAKLRYSSEYSLRIVV